MNRVMEFLVTYGWVIIAVLIAFSVLYFSGILLDERKDTVICFENTATRICEENNMTFVTSGVYQTWFYCEDEFTRERGYKNVKLYFTDEEIEKCEGELT